MLKTERREAVCKLVDKRNTITTMELASALCNREGINLCCIGGTYRPSTGAFVGAIAEDVLSHLGIDAAFIGLNGIFNHTASTSNMPEGRLQRIALDRANLRYLLADSSKLDRRDFYGFYDLVNVDALMTDRLITSEQEGDLSQYTKVVTG